MGRKVLHLKDKIESDGPKGKPLSARGGGKTFEKGSDLNNDEAVSGANLKKTKVLLVDDNYEFFQISQMSFREHLEIDYAGDGFTALQMVKRSTYELIICDVLMPLINGLVLLQEFKKKNIEIPFLFITGNANDKIIREAFHAGAYNLIEKPFKREDVLQKINSALTLFKEERPTELTDQEKAYIYNTLKMYYYDVEKIIRSINHANMTASSVHKELEKKVRTGKCAFDDLHNLKYYKNVS